MDAADVTRGSLSPEQVALYTDALTRHSGEPVQLSIDQISTPDTPVPEPTSAV